MKVLITGGNGFIGRYVCEVLRERGLEPVRFDRTAANADVLGDIRDAVAVDQAVADCDAVMHLAGVLGTAETVENPRPSVDTNISGGLNVFDAIRRYKVPAVNILGANHWMPNPYSVTKKAAEMFALMYNNEFGTKIALVRGLNVYGPGQKSYPVRKIMPNLIVPALRGEPITLYGDGNQVMDMIYVTDVAEILVDALIKAHGCYGEVMEAGTGRETTVNDLAEAVLRALGKEMVEGETVVHVPMRAGEPPNSVVLGDPRTLKPLGWTENDFITLEDGLKLTIGSYVVTADEVYLQAGKKRF
jgi:UDP-glucose 4-epimerase